MKKLEQFQDKIVRLFPPEKRETGLRTRTITFQVTDDCNLKCTYCYQHNKGCHVMDFEIAKRFIDLLLSDSNEYINRENSDAIIIEFIGGEPFIAIDVMDKITDYFISQMIVRQHPWATRYRISISSNGTLYFDEKVQAYIKKNRAHISLSISIDGNKTLHDACRVFSDGSGSYDIAMSAVRHYVDVFGGEMGSKMTLAPENIEYTAQAVESLIKSGYTHINLNCVYEKGWEAKHASTFYYQLKELADFVFENNLQDKVFLSIFQEQIGQPMAQDNIQNWCGGLGHMISIDYKGDIFPCIRYMESSLGNDIEPIIIGTVDGGIMRTDKEKKWVSCMACVTRKTQSTDECFYCPIANGCAWCSAYNYEETGSVDKRVTYICEMHKARVLANTYFWNTMYRLSSRDARIELNVPREWAIKIIPEVEYDMLITLSDRGQKKLSR